MNSPAERWYEQQRPGTGAAFVQAVDTAISRILAMPELYPVVHDDVRCALLRRFPYGVYYRVTDTHLIVIAVYHSRRDPSGWQSRT
jgi:plasmid stabilization system protein ParE